MRFGVLGSLEVRQGDARVDVAGRQQRLVLASLLAAAGHPVSADALVDAIWGETPPPSAVGTLQSYVSRLRKLVDPDGSGPKLVFDEAGYRLEVDPAMVDFRRFEVLADEGHALLEQDRPQDAATVLGEALGLWRGAAFGELASLEAFTGIATRLDERRLTAIEDRVEADLRLGRHAAIVGDLAELVAQHPLREGLRAQLALALYRSGRQADALASLAEARETLRDELGVDPGHRLRELEAAILNHDAALDPAPRRGATPPGADTTGEAPALPSLRSGLVGRDAEVDVLLQALAEAGTDARFVVVEGEPGIGKTRLADELRALATTRGSLAVWGRSDESGAAPALWPWLPILRGLHEWAGSDAGALDDLLAGDAPVLAGRGAAVRFERFEAIAEQLESAGTELPVVVLLDDIQWADETSLDLLLFLTTRLRRGVLVVATVRTLELGRSDAVTGTLGAIAGRPGSRRLQLGGLSASATAALLDTAGFVADDTSLVHRIHTRAEGNPFYALELARLLDEAAASGPEVPATVRDVIRRRLGHLPEATRDLLTVAAITGRDVDVHLLARAADLPVDQCLDRIEPAVVHRYLIDSPDRPGVLRFCHTLVREVLLDGLTPLRRARLHLSVADAIEAAGASTDAAEIVADHLWRAAPIGVGKRAAEALERAAEVALHRVSYAAAEELLQRSVHLRRATATADDDVRAELRTVVRLLEVMQATRYFQGADRGALVRAQELAERFGDEDLHRKLDWFEWAALSTAAHVQEAATLADRFLAQPSAEHDPSVRSSALAMYGTSCWQQGRFRDAVTHLDAGVALLADVGPPADAFDIEQRVVLSSFRLVNHALHGDWPADEVFAGFLDLMASAPAIGVSSICGFAGSTAACLGRWDHLAVHVDRAFTADPGSQFAFWGGQLLMQRGILEAQAGRVDEGLASFTEGERRYLAIGGRTSLANFRSVMALVVAQQGRGGDAARLAATARDADVDEPWSESLVHIADAAVAHAGGDRQRALRSLASARTVAAEQEAHGFVRRVASVAAELGLELPAAVTG